MRQLRFGAVTQATVSGGSKSFPLRQHAAKIFQFQASGRKDRDLMRKLADKGIERMIEGCEIIRDGCEEEKSRPHNSPKNHCLFYC